MYIPKEAKMSMDAWCSPFHPVRCRRGQRHHHQQKNECFNLVHLVQTEIINGKIYSKDSDFSVP